MVGFRVAVVLVCFDRPAATRRALRAIEALRIPPGCDVAVVVSQDAPTDRRVVAEVRAAAARFPIDHRMHPRHLGLRRHILVVGSAAAQYDLLVVLEDDVVVGPSALEHLLPAVRAYGRAPEVAQFSLYSPSFLESSRWPFLPLDDGLPGYLLGTPMSWGFAVVPEQWARFVAHLEVSEEHRAAADALLPDYAAAWPRASSWKRDLFAHMLLTGSSAWVPRTSLATQFGDAGTHHPTPIRHGRVPLSVGSAPGGDRQPPVDRLMRYDFRGELSPASLRRLAPDAAAWPAFVMDVHGLRPRAELGDDLVLTSRSVRTALRTFGTPLAPLEANVVLGMEGTGLALARVDDVLDTRVTRRPSQTARAAPNAFAVELLLGDDHLFRMMRMERFLGRALTGVIARVVRRLLRGKLRRRAAEW